jgi:hypothetical protein
MTDHIQKIHYFHDSQIACCTFRAPKILEGKFYATNTQFVTCERCIDSLQDCGVIGNDRDCTNLSINISKGKTGFIVVLLTEAQRS